MKLLTSAHRKAEGSQIVVEDLVERIYAPLSAGSSVLWLVSGGSNIQAAVEIQNQLIERCSLQRLTVGLIDERYGMRGHVDSNWQQLHSAGWNENTGTILEVLKDPAVGLQQTAEEYETALNASQVASDLTIALFGIGADGHTAGILPNSPIVDSTRGVDSFVGTDYERISITPTWIPRIDVAVVAAFGTSKNQALNAAFQDGPVAQIPARALATAKSLIVYTDSNLDSGN